VEVRRLVAFFICGSEKVSHISLTSPGAKKRSMISILVRKKATFVMPSFSASVAPVHIRAPFISTPIKFLSEYIRPSPTVYSPRPVPEEELETFEEAGACGTAAVISPIQRIDDLENKKSYIISKDGKPGSVCTKLYNKLRAIQYGDEPDTHNWVTILD
jgi:hypothetical protein